MSQIYNILAVYFAMTLAPFYGDIFSSAAQMTVKTVMPFILG